MLEPPDADAPSSSSNKPIELQRNPPSSSASTPPPSRAAATARSGTSSSKGAGARARARAGYHERVQRELQRDGRRLRELQERLSLTGAPRLIPRAIVVMCRTILADATGAAGKIYLRRCSNRVYAGAVATAAFVPCAGGCRYDWADSRARAIVALGCALQALSVPTRRRGCWTHVVRGVTQGALCALLANPFAPERRPSRSALAGVHRSDASLDNGQLGYLRALQAAGALYAQQLPSTDVAGFERVWPSGYTSNRYWLVTDRADGPDSERRRAALHALRALADSIVGPAARRLSALSRALRRAALRAPPAPS